MTKKEANEYVKDSKNWWLHSENNMFKSETLSFNGLHFVRLSKKSVANIIEVYMGKEEERLEELADKLQDLRPQKQWKPTE